MESAHNAITILNSFKDKKVEAEFRNYMASDTKKTYFFFALVYSIVNSCMVISYWVYSEEKDKKATYIITPMCMIYGTLILYGIGIKWPRVQMIGTMLYFLEMAALFSAIYPKSLTFVYRYPVTMTFLQVASVMQIFAFEWILALSSLSYISFIVSINIRFKEDKFLVHYNLIIVISAILFSVYTYIVARMQRKWFGMHKQYEKESGELKKLLNFLQLGVVIRDHKTILFMNDNAKSIFDGPNFNEVIIKETSMLFNKQPNFGFTYTDSITWTYKQREFEIRATKVDLFGEDNMLFTFFDISKIKQEEKDLYYKKIMHTMNHDIKSPLNTIYSMLSDIKMNTEKKDVHKSASIAMNACTIMFYSIEDMIDFNNYYEGKLKLDIIPFNISPIIEEAVNLVKVNAYSKEVVLTFQTNNLSTDNIQVFADQKRTMQILLNLILNSIKSTSTGLVTLACTCDSERVYISVEDTGAGMKSEDIENIFTSLCKFEISSSNLCPGIGLIFSHIIAQAMNGCIKFDSQIGKGSIFSLSLPKAINPIIQNENPEKMELPGYLRAQASFTGIEIVISSCKLKGLPKVLIINDSEFIFYSFKIMSSKVNIYFERALSVQDAIRMLKESPYLFILIELGNSKLKIGRMEVDLVITTCQELKVAVIGYFPTLAMESSEYKELNSYGLNECLYGPISVNTLKELRNKYMI